MLLTTVAVNTFEDALERAEWYAARWGIRLRVINPGFVQGAPLDKTFGTSIDVIRRILRGKDPMVPDIGFATVDVQDVAELHVKVIDRPETAGQRVMAVDRFMTFQEMAKAIKAAHPNRKIATRVAPHLLVRFLGLFDPAIRSIIPSLGKVDRMDNARAMALLRRGMRQAPKAAVSSATYLVENDLV